MRAEALLRRLAFCEVDTDTIEVAIGVDGGVEITALSGDRLLIVEIPQSGSFIEMLIVDAASAVPVSPTQRVTEDDIVLQFERAA